MAGFVELAGILGVSVGFLYLIFLLMLFGGVMKTIALWKSARHHQIAWFIFLAIINSMGILPLIYILFFQKKGKKK